MNFEVLRHTLTPFGVFLQEGVAAMSKGREGASVKYDVSVMGGDPSTTVLTCSHRSGAVFPLGVTTVTCEARDGQGNYDVQKTTVTVYDGTPPALSLPAPFEISDPESDGEAIKYSASATDDVDGALRVDCVPQSGTIVRPGITRVNCEAVDGSLNSAVGAFDIMVRPADTGVLQLRTPGDMRVPAQSRTGALVEYEVIAYGSADPDPVVDCRPASGTWFPIGVTKVGCRAIDDFNQRADAAFNVEVTSDFSLDMPDVSSEATSPEGSEVVFELKAEGWEHAITCSPAPGSRFPLGTTTVRCESQDGRGRVATGSFEVEVADTIAPHIDRATARAGAVDAVRGVVPVAVDVDVIDAADLHPRCTIAGLTSDTAGEFDWRIRADLELEVRTAAPRAYRIQVSCADAAGNRSTALVPFSIAGTGAKRITKVQ